MKSKWHLSGARAAMAIALGMTVLSIGTVTAKAADLIVGVSWSNFQEERWKTDEKAIKDALAKAGAKYISADAQTSPTKQAADIENLISQGAKVLIILAQDSGTIGSSIQKAMDEKIPVIG